MAKLLRSLGVSPEKITTAETASFVYACDRIGKSGAFFMEQYQDDSKVVIKREKHGLPFAALPATKTREVLRKVNQFLPSVLAATNVLETSINNVNPISHPAGVILNAGWIEHSKGAFSFYLDGQTPAVKKVEKGLDNEKMALAAALGFMQTSNDELTRRMYAKYVSESTGEIHQDKYYKGVNDAPPNLKHRYLTEDVIYGLVPMASIARVAGIKTPTIDAIVNLAGVVNEEDYWVEGMTLDKLGLSGMTPKEMIGFVNGVN
jgi:opine dehydrogenase